MNLVVIHKDGNHLSDKGVSSKFGNLLQFAINSKPLAGIILNHLRASSPDGKESFIAISEDWAQQTSKAQSDIIYYKENLPISALTGKFKGQGWLTISNGRFVTEISFKHFYKTLARLEADVIALNAEPELQSGSEKLIATSQNNLVGFRRYYNDALQRVTMSDDWPHYLFIKKSIVNKIMVGGTLPLMFSNFIELCTSNMIKIQSLKIGGLSLDLHTERGLLGLIELILERLPKSNKKWNCHTNKQVISNHRTRISSDTRLFGKVIFGENVNIARDAIIVGPAVLGDNVTIANGAVIKSSIIGDGTSVHEKNILQNRVLFNGHNGKRNGKPVTNTINFGGTSKRNIFKSWPTFSYVRFFKRFADITSALIVLTLFAPVIPIIALAIKLSSRGPVFYKDKRQGLHGKVFNCLKFRTMILGADKIQDRLRVLNQVDGPQFKLDDDPRISAVGRFLRDTYIDEIPQFFNVLAGEMSAVGPRPSPETENTSCPSWRDARLSVRPGITGLWQVCRTRQPMKDFQEWIHYDLKYVRNVSLKMDLWICWKTAKKMASKFINQF